jgi:hypothetical protein
MVRGQSLKRSAVLGVGLLLLVWSIQQAAGANIPAGSASFGEASQPGPPYVYYFPLMMQGATHVAQSNIPLYGVNFISSAEDRADEQQYQNGLATGARWNRWPLYWYRVEQNQAIFDWSAHDALVQQDIAHDLKINAILMGTPGFYVSGASLFDQARAPETYKTFGMSALNASTPSGLYAPVFSDGSDLPGPGKSINPDNKWARFVSAAVQRYKPGGDLARQSGWPAGTGISHWEMWNEPDMSFFWSSSVEDYARLLKVGYLAAKHSDPNAWVLFGGLANNLYFCARPDPSQPHFLDQVLGIYDGDPLAPAHGYYFDILATHNYSRSWDSWCLVFRAGRSMTRHNLDKPIWLNETGVPAWDDYPGPMWDPTSPFRATMNEQADFTVQTLFYAVWAGADAVFYFQLYDGCGNQPAGTDPPYNPSGSHCDASGLYNGLPCAGDANGFFRNPTDAACFTHHPFPETARPKMSALQVLATYLKDVVPLDRQRPGGIDGGQEWISYYRPATNERIMALWARFNTAQTAFVPAVNPGGTALLLAPDGASQAITASGGFYTIQLPGATNQNTPWDLTTGYPIGGRTFMLIEPCGSLTNCRP